MYAPPPKLNLLVIRSPDIDRAATFYQTLGLLLGRHAHGSGPEHFVAVVDGLAFEIYPLLKGQLPTTDARFGFTVDSVDELVPLLEAAGAVVAVRPHDRDGGRHAVLRDFDGHRVELFTPAS